MTQVTLDKVTVAYEEKTFVNRQTGEKVNYIEYTFFICGVPVHVAPGKSDKALLKYLLDGLQK